MPGFKGRRRQEAKLASAQRRAADAKAKRPSKYFLKRHGSAAAAVEPAVRYSCRGCGARSADLPTAGGCAVCGATEFEPVPE